MSLKSIVVRTFSRSVLQVRKYSPEILTGVGVVGVVTAGVLASKATLKLESVVEELESTKEKISEAFEAAADNEEVDYSTTDRRNDLAITYSKFAINLVKLYGPSVSLGVASIGCILGAHGILRKRNIILAAAYKAAEETYKEYRKRVVEEFGEDKDFEFSRGLKKATVETVDEKTGEKKEETGFVVEGKHISQYARFFDQFSSRWENNAEYNLTFLIAQQNYMNDLLKSRGHVFLNEVYDALGLDHTRAGALCGWISDGDGDGYIDFGIYDPNSDTKRNFVNGHEKAILLDFNVDGPIFNLI